MKSLIIGILAMLLSITKGVSQFHYLQININSKGSDEIYNSMFFVFVDKTLNIEDFTNHDTLSMSTKQYFLDIINTDSMRIYIQCPLTSREFTGKKSGKEIIVVNDGSLKIKISLINSLLKIPIEECYLYDARFLINKRGVITFETFTTIEGRVFVNVPNELVE